MEIPLVNVTARICDQQGRPVHRAQITMRLTTVERYCGLVVPREVRAETDPQGKAVLRVWPNELGTEGSEYLVTISFPEACHTSCGKHPSHLPPLHSLRYRCTVPNSDCNLQDIAELPPYEQRGSGQVITTEVAAFASQAASAADRAQNAVETIGSIRTSLEGLADETTSAKVAAQEAARQAQSHERRVRELLGGVDDTICHFENSVTARTERTAQRLVKEATVCITQAKTDALEAIEQRSGDVLHEIGKASSDAQGTAVNTIAAVRENAVQAIATAKTDALRELHEDAALFGEDFENLTERALSAAKRAGCSAASAQNSAVKACECAEKATQAAQGMERYRDEALAAAQQAQSAAECAQADAQRAEAAADSVEKNTVVAKSYAEAAAKQAKAADGSAKGASESAKIALEAASAVKEDRSHVEAITENLDTALATAAADIVTEHIVAEAIEQATAEATNAAREAAESASNAEQAVTDARGETQKRRAPPGKPLNPPGKRRNMQPNFKTNSTPKSRLRRWLRNSPYFPTD